MELRAEIRNLNRLKQVIQIFVEQGFGYFVEKTGLASLVQFQHKKSKMPPEVRLRLTLEKLGPTFIKLGQVLSLRTDIIPKNYARELSKLQSDVEPAPFDKIKDIIEKQFNKPLDALFSEFEKIPIASASLSQVHRAKLGNKTIAVKVKRPNVDYIMEQDIEIMLFIASLVQKHVPWIKKYHPRGLVEEFSHWTRQELDFLQEAESARKFSKNFINDKSVKIPYIYRYLCGHDVLTLEFIDGIEINKTKKLKASGFDIKKGIRNGIEAMLKQIFEHGFFHADPHPGNIFLLKDGRIAFVDFGIVGKFDRKLKDETFSILYGFIERDTDRIVDALLNLGIISSRVDKAALKEDLEEIMEPLQESSVREIKLGSAIEKVIGVAMHYEIKLPLPFVLFGKTILTLEGIALEYDPDFRIIEESRPFLERLIKKDLAEGGMQKEFMRNALKFGKTVRDLPEEATKALKKLQEGKIKVEVSDVKRLSLEIDRSSNRLAYGMVIAALILAGALTINTHVWKIFGFPMISLFSFMAAAILGVLLFISIRSERDLKR